MEKEKKTRQSRKKLAYGVDVGTLVAQCIEDNPKLSYQIVADRMGIGKAALLAKVKLPYFGTADTIAAASVAIGVNLFEPYLAWLKKEGIPSNDEYASNKLLLTFITEENESLKKELADLKKVHQYLIDKLPIADE